MAGKQTYSDEFLLERVLEFSSKFGEQSKRKNFDAYYKCTPTHLTVLRRFGTWEHALLMAKEAKKDGKEDTNALVNTVKFQQDRIDKLESWGQLFVDVVKSSVERFNTIKVTAPKPIKIGKSHYEHANLLLSDAQVGTKFELADTMGKNAYDFDMFIKNCGLLKDAVQKIMQIHSASYPVPRLNIWAAGDDVEGELIFPGQQFFIDKPLIDQVFEGAKEIAEIIIYWSQIIQEIHVYQVPGNHGRPGKRGENHPRTNWDTVFWMIVQLMVEKCGCKNVHFHLSKSSTLVAQVFGHNFLLSHGSETRGWMGIPFYGRNRDVLKLVNALEIPIKLALCGHHHNYASWDVAPRCEIVMNGSWIGGSPYSTTELKTINSPKQIMWGTSRKRAKTWMYPIELHKIKKLEANEAGLFTPTL